MAPEAKKTMPKKGGGTVSSEVIHEDKAVFDASEAKERKAA